MDAQMKKRMVELAAEMKPQLIDFAQRLIRCPSLSGQEKEVSEIILKELAALGYDDSFRDELGNIIGVVRGSEEGPSIMYNSHMDHVDVGDLSEWEGYDPYGAEIDLAEIENEARDGVDTTQVIHGRAASDTKGGMACQIYSGAILAGLKKEGFLVKGQYIFTAAVLEEPAEQIGMIGLYENTLPRKGYRVDGVVSSEATGLKLYLGHRGRVELEVEVCGVTSHGSAPWLGVNAVNKAVGLIEQITQRFENSDSIACDEKLGKSSIALTIISCSPGSMCIVPDRCNITFDRRIVPEETPEQAVLEIQEIIDALAAEDKDFRATVKVATVPRTTYTKKTVALPNIKQAWKIGEDHPYVKACARALSGLGEPVNYGYWDFGTDLALLCGKYHIPAVGYSPMQEYYCHRPVDKVRIDFMERALLGNVAIFDSLADVDAGEFKL